MGYRSGVVASGDPPVENAEVSSWHDRFGGGEWLVNALQTWVDRREDLLSANRSSHQGNWRRRIAQRAPSCSLGCGWSWDKKESMAEVQEILEEVTLDRKEWRLQWQA